METLQGQKTETQACSQDFQKGGLWDRAATGGSAAGGAPPPPYTEAQGIYYFSKNGPGDNFES